MRLCESQTSHFPSKYCPSWSADSNRQMSCREQPPPHCECGTFPARRQKVWTPTAKPLKVNFTCLFCDYRLILLFNCPDAVNLSRPSGMPSRRKQCLRVIWSDYLSHAWRCVCVGGRWYLLNSVQRNSLGGARPICDTNTSLVRVRRNINTVNINMITRYAWWHYRSAECTVCDGELHQKIKRGGGGECERWWAVFDNLLNQPQWIVNIVTKQQRREKHTGASLMTDIHKKNIHIENIITSGISDT